MQYKTGRFVIGREDNVLRMDFSRDTDPPVPRFPGACGLREIVAEFTSATAGISGPYAGYQKGAQQLHSKLLMRNGNFAHALIELIGS